MNTRVFRIAAACLILALATAVPAHAGAWTVPKGGWYHKLSATYFAADSEFDTSHDEQPFELEGRFTQANLIYYGEYGIIDSLTAVWSIPLRKVHYTNLFEEGETTGIADVELGLRVRLAAKNSFFFSFQGLFMVPGGYDGADTLPLGNDQNSAEARLLMGASALGGRIYFGGEAAYRYRSQEPSDEWRFLVELGGNFSKVFYGRLKLSEIRSLENQDDIRDVFGNPLVQFASELRGAELTLGARLSKRWSGEASWLPIVYGRSIAKGDTWVLAAVYSF